MFDLSNDIHDVKSTITEWELMQPQSITEKLAKENKLAELRDRLNKLQALEIQPAPQPQATPVVAASASGGDEAWKGKARERAYEIIKRDRAKSLYPSQTNIADEIAKEFRRDGVMGVDGKPIAGGYIKRHALNSISSAQGKQLSTISRGK